MLAIHLNSVLKSTFLVIAGPKPPSSKAPEIAIYLEKLTIDFYILWIFDV